MSGIVSRGIGDGEEDDIFGDGIETPRNGGVSTNTEREREREFLDSLKYVLIFFMPQSLLIFDISSGAPISR